MDWGRVEVFWGDERCVPPDDKDSNYHMAQEAMLSRLPIPPDRVHRMQAERPDLDAAARDYQAVIARTFGVDAGAPPPAFDLVLLGMGPDGHTASLFPDTTALDETTRWVVVNHVPKFAANRLTMTYPLLNSRSMRCCSSWPAPTRRIGWPRFWKGRPTRSRLPSQRVQPANGLLAWFVDRRRRPGSTPTPDATPTGG